MSYPTRRNLDGVYFRVQRDGKWLNICYSDMTDEERKHVICDRMDDKPLEEQASYYKRLAEIMANTLHEVGDVFGIVGEDE